jgi:peptidoglycan/LPS O-acetylase OafA/YrhL
MRLRHRDDDVRTDDVRTDNDVYRRDRDVVEERAVEETTVDAPSRWDIGSVLATAAGVALTVLGAVTLVRTGINETWYSPVEEVGGISATPLLGAIELGVGVLLILTGLAGANMLAALIAIAAGVGALVVAIDPGTFEQELAFDRDWAIAFAIGFGVLVLMLLATQAIRHDRRVERRSVRTA